MRYIVTVAKAAIASENVVVLNALIPPIAMKGSIRMAGKGGYATNQCPLKEIRSPVAGGLIRNNFPCRNEKAR